MSCNAQSGWRLSRIVLVALVVGVLSSNAFAQLRPAVLDAAAVPYLDAAERDIYARFLLLPLPRAVAIAPNGKVAGYHNTTPGQAREHALALCAERGGAGCAIYAEDYDVVWQGRPRVPCHVAANREICAVRDNHCT